METNLLVLAGFADEFTSKENVITTQCAGFLPGSRYRALKNKRSMIAAGAA